MSYDAKSDVVQTLRLKVQSITVRNTDTGIYDANSGNGKITIGEAISEVRLAIQKDNSANALVHFANASIDISGSTYAVITGLVLDTNDSLIFEYVVTE